MIPFPCRNPGVFPLQWQNACKVDRTGFVYHFLSTVTRPMCRTTPQAHQAALGFPPPSLEGALTQSCFFLSIDHSKHPHWVLVTLNSTQRGSPISTNTLWAQAFLALLGGTPHWGPYRSYPLCHVTNRTSRITFPVSSSHLSPGRHFNWQLWGWRPGASEAHRASGRPKL